jgi:hypothetical protein
MSETNCLVSAILKIIHPDLYIAGRECLLKLLEGPDCVEDPDNVKEIALLWSSVFNAMSVISNRSSPPHRDPKTRSEWYDILLTVGPYSVAWLDLPATGLRLLYKSGTFVAFSGKFLRHGVEPVDGERVCVAYYMRDNVQE